MDIWLPPREPWRLKNPFPSLNSNNATIKILSYLGWLSDLPAIMQTLSHSTRSYIIFVQDVGIEKFIVGVNGSLAHDLAQFYKLKNKRKIFKENEFRCLRMEARS